MDEISRVVIGNELQRVGDAVDEVLLADLPASADPCGENGEFHSFVYDGPMFPRPIPVALGEIVHRDGFVFADLLPADSDDRSCQLRERSLV